MIQYATFKAGREPLQGFAWAVAAGATCMEEAETIALADRYNNEPVPPAEVTELVRVQIVNND